MLTSCGDDLSGPQFDWDSGTFIINVFADGGKDVLPSDLRFLRWKRSANLLFLPILDLLLILGDPPILQVLPIFGSPVRGSSMFLYISEVF